MLVKLLKQQPNARGRTPFAIALSDTHGIGYGTGGQLFGDALFSEWACFRTILKTHIPTLGHRHPFLCSQPDQARGGAITRTSAH
jgi:hypothetical protein